MNCEELADLPLPEWKRTWRSDGRPTSAPGQIGLLDKVLRLTRWTRRWPMPTLALLSLRGWHRVDSMHEDPAEMGDGHRTPSRRSAYGSL